MRCMVWLWLAVAAVAWGAEPTASWEGLVGGYTMPTAQTYARPTASVVFAEIRFAQETETTTLRDSTFSGLLTLGVSSRWETCMMVRNELLRIEPMPGLVGPTEKHDEDYFTGGLKLILRTPRQNQWGFATGVMDIADATKTLGDFNPQRGRRAFLVGTLNWASFGATYSNHKFGAYGVANLRVTDGLETVIEYNTHPVFAQLASGATNPNNFNIGLRLRPEDVRAGHIDLAAAGDGTFSFSFAIGYEAPAGLPYPKNGTKAVD